MVQNGLQRSQSEGRRLVMDTGSNKCLIHRFVKYNGYQVCLLCHLAEQCSDVSFKEKLKKCLCKLFGHRWDEFHMYDVLCSRCYQCRPWTHEDELAFEKTKIKWPS